LPLSAKARIEVYLPDLLSLASQELLIAFNQEFTHTFGGATLWRGLDGSYLAQNGETVRDRINLLDEFSFRCIYCLLREQWGRVRGFFAIDHFLPVAIDPGAALDYENLLYVCAACNAVKGKRRLPNPLTALTGGNVYVSEDGVLHSESAEAARLIERLGLNSDESVEFRFLWIGIIALAAKRMKIRVAPSCQSPDFSRRGCAGACSRSGELPRTGAGSAWMNVGNSTAPLGPRALSIILVRSSARLLRLSTSNAKQVSTGPP
jgi:hypothetical protein